MANDNLAGTLGRISTLVVPEMVPLMARIASRAGDVAEKTVKLVTVIPLIRVTEAGKIVFVVSLIVTA